MSYRYRLIADCSFIFLVRCVLVRCVLVRCVLVLCMLVLCQQVAWSQQELELLPPLEPTVESTVDEILAAPVEEVATPSLSTVQRWFESPIWSMNAELGINGSAGNAETLSLLVSSSIVRKTDASLFDVGISYGKTQSSGVETQHYAILKNRWDWNVTERWFWFKKSMLEYDEFKAFDVRLASSTGIGYDLIKTESLSLKSRFGAGTSREFGGPDDDWVPESDFGLDYEHKLSDRQELKASVDYFPSWNDFEDFRLVTDAGWKILLDEQTNLSLKVGFTDRYDSTPNGARHNDVDYYVTLLWKL